MLRAVPKHWFSWDFQLLEGDQPLTLLELTSFREAGAWVLDGATYNFSRKGYFSSAFTMEKDGQVLACAQKPSAWKRALEIEHGAARYTLKAESHFGRGFVLLDGDRTIGTLRPEHSFTRAAAVDLPESIPLPVRIFITWLAIVMWKRQADASSGA